MPRSSHEEFRSRRSFGSLDGIRCLSIVAVLWHHTVVGVDWLPGTKRGFLGVDMFFVLSGFLIVTLLLRERDRTGSVSLPNFYARRALRIFPAYYGLLAVLATVFALLGREGSSARPFFEELPYFLTYTANWVELHSLLAITWSLAAEEQFYVVWPPIERFAGRIAVPVLLAIIAANQLVNFGVLEDAMSRHWGLRTGELPMLQATFTPICLGVLIAHVLHSQRGFELVSRGLSSRWASPLALSIVIGLCNARPGDISGLPRLLIQLSMAGFLCTCVTREDHGLRRVLTLPVVARVGVISYGVYLYHPIARHAAEWATRRLSLDLPLSLFATCLALTIAVAEVSYRYYETPFLRMKDWLHPRDESSSRLTRAEVE